MEIFKIQVPLAGEQVALIYNEDNSVRGHLPITKEIKAVMGGKYKKYVWGKHLENGQLEIHTEAEEQEW